MIFEDHSKCNPLIAKLNENCNLLSSGTKNSNTDYNTIICTIKGTKFCVPVVTLSAKDNKKLSKFLKNIFSNVRTNKKKQINKQNKASYPLSPSFMEHSIRHVIA